MAISAESQEGLNSLNAAMNAVDVTGLNGDYSTTKADPNATWYESLGRNLGFNTGNLSSSGLVGITPELATAFGAALDEYKQTIGADLDAMVAKEATVGFKGEAVNEAIKNFVARVIEVSKEYLEALDGVHRDIIAQVEANYQSQDEGISLSVSGDASSISSQKFNGGGSN